MGQEQRVWLEGDLLRLEDSNGICWERKVEQYHRVVTRRTMG